MKKEFWQKLSWFYIARIAVLFCIFLAFSIGFIELADEVKEGDTQFYDEAILTAINTTSNSFWDTFFFIITNFGGVIGVLVITLGIAALLVLRKKYKKTILLISGVAGAALINVLLKLIFERTRPDLWHQLVVETSFSFPSGHAMASSALAFSVIALLWNTKYRWPAVLIGAAFTILIGFSRLYLGVHYPTDILAGWCVSGLWVLLVVFALNAKVSWRKLFIPDLRNAKK